MRIKINQPPQDVTISMKNKLANMNLTIKNMFEQIKMMTPLFAAILLSQNKVFIEEIILQVNLNLKTDYCYFGDHVFSHSKFALIKIFLILVLDFFPE